MALNSGTSEMSTRYVTAKFFILSAVEDKTSSICMHVSSQSCPQRITTTRDSSCEYREIKGQLTESLESEIKDEILEKPSVLPLQWPDQLHMRYADVGADNSFHAIRFN